MKQEQIETIIENLAKSGYKFQSEKTEDGSIRVRISDNSQILFSFKNDSLSLCIVRVKYKLNYSKKQTDFLNKIAHSMFYFYYGWFDFKHKPTDEKELEDTLKNLIENFN